MPITHPSQLHTDDRPLIQTISRVVVFGCLVVWLLYQQRIVTYAQTGLLATGGADGVIRTWDVSYDNPPSLPEDDATESDAESRPYFGRAYRLGHVPNAICFNADCSLVCFNGSHNRSMVHAWNEC
jgi:WD40 repeat protein